MTILHLPIRERSFVQDNSLLEHEADHRIANNLGMIVSLLRLRGREVARQKGKIERAEVSLMLEDVAARVETVAQLHRMLSQSYRNALVDIGAYLRELCQSLTRSLAPGTQVHIPHHVAEACAIPPDQVLTIGLLVSELVTNAVKYAHPAGLPVRLDIACEQNAGQLTIEVADDGVGLPEGFDPAVDGELGLRVVRSLANQLSATIHFDSSPLGTRVRLVMPISFDGAA